MLDCLVGLIGLDCSKGTAQSGLYLSNRINRYTTVDRNKTKETKEYFEQEFERHLHTAVLGINLEESKCFEDENLNCRNIITFNEFTP